MPSTRLSMRKTREILRLRWGLGLGVREPLDAGEQDAVRAETGLLIRPRQLLAKEPVELPSRAGRQRGVACRRAAPCPAAGSRTIARPGPGSARRDRPASAERIVLAHSELPQGKPRRRPRRPRRPRRRRRRGRWAHRAPRAERSSLPRATRPPALRVRLAPPPRGRSPRPLDGASRFRPSSQAPSRKLADPARPANPAAVGSGCFPVRVASAVRRFGGSALRRFGASANRRRAPSPLLQATRSAARGRPGGSRRARSGALPLLKRSQRFAGSVVEARGRGPGLRRRAAGANFGALPSPSPEPRLGLCAKGSIPEGSGVPATPRPASGGRLNRLRVHERPQASPRVEPLATTPPRLAPRREGNQQELQLAAKRLVARASRGSG